MIRSLLFIGLFVQGLGCPAPPLPPVVPPTPVVVDAGADVSTCNVTRAMQDRITNIISNECAKANDGSTVSATLVYYNLVDVRCVAADMLLDLRGAPVTEACVGNWLSQHGGAP
jgi:hypothetical protein